jgi:DNA-3-methyladenine glycosylase II
MQLATRTAPLTPAAPFAFAHSLSFLRSFSATSGEQRVETNALTKAFSIDGRAVLATVRGEDDALFCTLTARDRIDEPTFERALERVAFQLSLDDDLAPFHALAADDRSFAPIARKWFGHHHVKFPSPFEIAAWSVLAQRNMRAGRKIKDAIVDAFGPRIEVDGVEHRAFPEPHAIDARTLRSIVRDESKADAIASIARTFRDLDVRRACMETSIEEATALLRSLPRIGAWSAAFILFRGLGRMEKLADRSGPIVQAARAVYGSISESKVRAIAERYGAWCGYWALYLRRG